MLKDIVCGMQVKPENVKVTTEYKDVAYYFCSQICKEKFEKEPEKFFKKKNFVARFIDWLAKGSDGSPRSCH